MAFLLTFRTYGTWLPGDARGWVDRAHRLPGSSYLPPDPQLERAAQLLLENRSPMLLVGSQRTLIHEAIHQVCRYRNYALHALNVRTNHVHAVLSAPEPPEKLLIALKAWATRRLREEGHLASSARVWARHGSTRYLWTQGALEAACRYVLDGQGPDPAS